jgi:exodeoxyribonuclease-3
MSLAKDNHLISGAIFSHAIISCGSCDTRNTAGKGRSGTIDQAFYSTLGGVDKRARPRLFGRSASRDASIRSLSTLKIATYNVNGINGRLSVLLQWLDEAKPDIVCLQELKAPNEKFPQKPLRDLGYTALWHAQKSWNGVAILSRVGEIHEVRRGLPGNPDDMQSRYIEAAVAGIVIAGLYLPNGNPRPGPKFDYKLRWFERLIAHAATLMESGHPVILAGDFNVMPTDLDVYKPERWLDDALFAPEVRAAYFELLEQGWTDALRSLHPGEAIYTFWDYFRNAYARNAGLRIDHLLLSPSLTDRLIAAGVDRHVRSWEKTSDHAPVWVDLRNRSKSKR